uniref:Uncharacterized protein n=1 Tax=Pseudomonas putida (strain ATCC 700007 / DSM 6899 / JCM 31910 / BCRC 17059 / LMG 24140 / F1) TaxID=351746 RepID=A5W4Q1_PSEP1
MGLVRGGARTAQG